MRLLCLRYRRELEHSADLWGGLAEGSPVLRHLASCPECRRAWSELRGLASELPAAVSAPEPSSEFTEAVWARLGGREPSPLPVFRRPAVAIGMGAAALGAAGVLLLGRPGVEPGRAVSGAPPFEAPLSGAADRDTQEPDPQHARALTPPPAERGPDPGAPDQALPARQRTAIPRTLPRHATGGRRQAPPPEELPGPTSATSDETYLDGRDAHLLARFTASDKVEQRQLQAIYRDLPPPADDFVGLSLPRVAGKDPASLKAAVQQYEREARVVDARLFRKVTLQAKGVPLAELCSQLKAQTGVELLASRGVADEKVTVLVKDRPAREVMRAVARLFNYLWGRTGQENAYRYELMQDLKGQLAEEELRNQDFRRALLALDAEMEKYRPFLGLTRAQLEDRFSKQSRDQQLFNVLHGYGWGGMQLYFRLTPAERTALAAGQELTYRTDSPDPDRRIPPEWQQPLLQSGGGSVTYQGQLTELREIPGARVSQVRLRIFRSELGEVSLKYGHAMTWKEDGSDRWSFGQGVLAIGRSPGATEANNRVLNRTLQGKAPFDQIVSVKPEPSCPVLKSEKRPTPGRVSRGVQDVPHVLSSDVWEAVHRATGQSVVADFYSRLSPLRDVTVERVPLFEALCEVGDRMNARWSKDGEFLLARSTSYFWDKLKEVPERHLQRWARSQEQQGGLPLRDFLEMATLSDPQLDSRRVADVLEHCRNLREWRYLGGRSSDEAPHRARARFLALLTPEQLAQALQPSGLPVRALAPAQQQAALQLYAEINREFERQGSGALPTDPSALANAEIYAEYAPAGTYLWMPPRSTPQRPIPAGVGPRYGRTAEEALAVARRTYPDAVPEEVRLSEDGHFSGGLRFVFRSTPGR